MSVVLCKYSKFRIELDLIRNHSKYLFKRYIYKKETVGRLHQQNLIPYLVKSHLYLTVT